MGIETVQRPVGRARRSLQFKLLSAVFLLMLVIIACGASVAVWKVRRQSEEIERQSLLENHQDYLNTLQLLQDTAAATAQSLADRHDIAALMRAQDRRGLFELLQPLFEELNHGRHLQYLYFHRPSGLVFLRLHRPEVFDDSVVPFRRSIVTAIQENTAVATVDLDQNGIGIRGIAPIMDGGEMIGLVEAGRDLGEAFIESMHALSGMDYRIWVTYEAAAPTGLWAASDAPPSPHPDVFHWAGTVDEEIPDLQAAYDRVLRGSESEFRLISSGGRELAVLVSPIWGFERRLIGIIEVSSDRGPTLTAIRQGQISVILISSTLALVGLGLLWLLIRRIVISPLNHLTAVADWQLGGALDARVEHLTNDEFGQLGTTFNVLSDRLAEILGEQRNTISELKKSQQQQQRLTAILENTQDLVSIATPDARVIYLNRAGKRLLGWHEDTEVIGKLISDAHPQWAYEILSQRGIPAALEHGFWQGETAILNADGREIPVSQIIMAHRAESGAIEYHSTIMRDLTERIRLEDQLRQSQKMEAVGQLAGGIAHDFNNLLLAIMGHVDLAIEGLAPSDSRREDLEMVNAAAETASTLTRQLLAFSRRQVLQPVDLDLNETVKDLMTIVRRLLGENIELEVIPGANLSTVHADRSQMEQVLLNLCVNARDAMPNGGRITVETENVIFTAEDREVHPWAQEGKYVLLSVTDTGCGMDRETLERIFEPFFTTKEVGRGTGLGLAMVYGIVTQHHGMIQAHSEPGQGSTFRVHLPAVDCLSDAARYQAAETVTGGTETILLAEDDASVRDLSRRVLEKAGYRVIVAADGLEALEAFEAHADEVDLLVLDVVMPKLGGPEVLSRIRKDHPTMPCLFASGYSASFFQRDLAPDERLNLLNKPYHSDALLRAVRSVLDRGCE